MRELQKLYDNVFARENEHAVPDYLKYRFNKMIFDTFPLHMKIIVSVQYNSHYRFNIFYKPYKIFYLISKMSPNI